MKKIALICLVCLLLAGCGRDGAPPAAPTPTIPPTAAATEAAATEAPAATQPPTERPTATAAPTETAAPEASPTTAPATATSTPETAADTPAAAATTAAPAITAAGTTAIPTGTPAASLDFLPQEGLWGGGARNLVLSFVIGRQGGQATLSELAIVWFGPQDCALDHKLTDVTLIEGPEFSRFYRMSSDLQYTLTGRLISPNQIAGKFDVSYKDCGTAEVDWWAIPKP